MIDPGNGVVLENAKLLLLSCIGPEASWQHPDGCNYDQHHRQLTLLAGMQKIRAMVDAIVGSKACSAQV